MDKIYTIEYACGCTMGNIRKNNEDNFYCDSKIRLDVDSVEDMFFCGAVSSESNETFAVFDGMGGEACGEIASFVAASNCYDFCKDRAQYGEYLCELTAVLNERVKEETIARSLVLMGTTAAMIQFNKHEIFISNVGDSRIYKLTNQKLSQISKDHVLENYNAKSPLTNFLGIPTDDFESYVARGSYKENDIFVLCTDGITDMIEEDVLKNVIREMTDNNVSLIDITKYIIDLAKENGGHDNATLVLCKICQDL